MSTVTNLLGCFRSSSLPMRILYFTCQIQARHIVSYISIITTVMYPRRTLPSHTATTSLVFYTGCGSSRLISALIGSQSDCALGMWRWLYLLTGRVVISITAGAKATRKQHSDKVAASAPLQKAEREESASQPPSHHMYAISANPVAPSMSMQCRKIMNIFILITPLVTSGYSSCKYARRKDCAILSALSEGSTLLQTQSLVLDSDQIPEYQSHTDTLEKSQNLNLFIQPKLAIKNCGRFHHSGHRLK